MYIKHSRSLELHSAVQIKQTAYTPASTTYVHACPHCYSAVVVQAVHYIACKQRNRRHACARTRGNRVRAHKTERLGLRATYLEGRAIAPHPHARTHARTQIHTDTSTRARSKRGEEEVIPLRPRRRSPPPPSAVTSNHGLKVNIYVNDEALYKSQQQPLGIAGPRF